MKIKVTLIIFLLLIIVLMVSILSGIKIAKFEIPSITSMKEKNVQLEEKIKTASTLTSLDYPETVDALEVTYEKLKIQKQKYEELVGLSDNDINKIYETKQYDIGFLWRIVGKYATSRNLTIGMEVKKGTEQNIYDLYFTVSGQYTNISQFITDIENNSDLYFRIYDFKMSGDSEKVTANFTVKNIQIDSSTLTTNVSSQNLNEEQM